MSHLEDSTIDVLNVPPPLEKFVSSSLSFLHAKPPWNTFFGLKSNSPCKALATPNLDVSIPEP